MKLITRNYNWLRVLAICALLSGVYKFNDWSIKESVASYAVFAAVIGVAIWIICKVDFTKMKLRETITKDFWSAVKDDWKNRALWIKKRWHLHGLVGFATVCLLMSVNEIRNAPGFNAIIASIAIIVVSVCFQALKEQVVVTHIDKTNAPDYSDVRAGGLYFTILALLIYHIANVFVDFTSTILLICACIFAVTTAVLVKIFKH